jgi:hypothetical protein
MKLTLGSIKAAQPALTKLLNADLPIATAFKLSKLVKAVENELTSYESQRVKLIEKLGEAEGDTTKVKQENLPAFVEEMTKLHDIECELPGDPIPVADLGDLNISAVDVALLNGVIS